MKKMVLTCCLMTLLTGVAYAGSQVVARSAQDDTKVVNQKKTKKQKMTKKKAEKLHKEAEKDAKRHQVQVQRREYQLMLDAQRRGMESQRQQQGQPPAK